MSESKIAGPWRIDGNTRTRVDSAGDSIAEVRMLEGDGYSWRAGAQRGVESGSDKCWLNHAAAVKAANAALEEQGYTLFESIAKPNRGAERKGWARLHKATEDLWMTAAIKREDAAKERKEQAAAMQSLRDLGIDLDALLGNAA